MLLEIFSLLRMTKLGMKTKKMRTETKTLKMFRSSFWPKPLRARTVTASSPKKTGIIMREIKPVLGRTPSFTSDLFSMLQKQTKLDSLLTRIIVNYVEMFSLKIRKKFLHKTINHVFEIIVRSNFDEICSFMKNIKRNILLYLTLCLRRVIYCYCSEIISWSFSVLSFGPLNKN